ncbi:type VI secretion system lipoprotein TssJ [Vibrio kasasachensis]|uniref:type VI secretion system lipoprotein TssJ n=1 Tax=Vibrio kasasachensis TaxID=2910248 RepID=UPI003D1355FF
MNKRSFVLLILLTVLTACSSSEKYEPEKLPTKVTFSLVSDEGTNPNIWGEATPIELQVFELEDDSMFMSADYDQMKEDYEGTLRSNFVDNYDYVLTPGQFKFVDAFEIDEDTNFIGVMAHFSEPELSEWKKAVKVLKTGREYHLLMYFKDYDVKLERVE